MQSHPMDSKEEKAESELNQLIDKLAAFLNSEIKSIPNDPFKAQDETERMNGEIKDYLLSIVEHFSENDSIIDIFETFKIAENNINDFIKKYGGILTEENVKNIIAINYISAYHLYDEQPFDLEDCSILLYGENSDKNGDPTAIVSPKRIDKLLETYFNFIPYNISPVASSTDNSDEDEEKMNTELDLDILDQRAKKIEANILRNKYGSSMWAEKKAEAAFLHEVTNEYKRESKQPFTVHLFNKTKQPGYQHCGNRTKQLIESMLIQPHKDILPSNAPKKK